ncbi:hypothetical protein [Amycolatopsis orientalis]|uniref:hypothetical protein n=1 Tax=Amycolatopsis orientalis TaxID=31958 RepID=UPI0004270A85|nr:hypothetical protein [Amycolatopsis orientalis]
MHELYEEVASAAGVYQPLLVPPAGTSRADAVRLLAAACTTRVTVTAAIHQSADGAPRFTLIRDPSVTDGAPGITDYAPIAASLKHDHGWRVLEAGDPSMPVTVMLGLREGYGKHAVVHEAAEVLALLGFHGVGGVFMTRVHLMCARHLDGDVDVYDEPGVLIVGAAPILPAVTSVAARLAQHRFVVTDRDQNRTYALRRR